MVVMSEQQQQGGVSPAKRVSAGAQAQRPRASTLRRGDLKVIAKGSNTLKRGLPAASKDRHKHKKQHKGDKHSEKKHAEKGSSRSRERDRSRSRSRGQSPGSRQHGPSQAKYSKQPARGDHHYAYAYFH